MDRWSEKFVNRLKDWRMNRTVQQRSSRIARDVFPELCESVRRKAIPQHDRIRVVNYARSRAAQLCYSRVDELVAVDPAISGTVATKIITQSATNAVEMVCLEIPALRRAVA
jgi:hypothetical protein